MDRKFLFDMHIFDAPPKEEIPEDLPPPPPVFSEEELAVAKDVAFEMGRQQGKKEEQESRDQVVTTLLSRIADQFSHLFAAESMRESVFEKEAVRLSIAALDVLFPTLSSHVGRSDVLDALQKTLTDHKKNKEILIKVPMGMKTDVEALIIRIRATEQDSVLWRIIEMPDMLPGDCTLEWADGGAVRDSAAAAFAIRKKMEDLLGDIVPSLSATSHGSISEKVKPDVRSKDKSESGDSDPPALPALENEHE